MRNIIKMKFLVLATIVQLLALVAQGQLSHFVYLQTENNQPFYIKHNNKIISSTSSGYIILSKLNDGVINFILGFPQSNEPEQKINLTIDKTEKGYLIKNFGDKGWGLFDLQSNYIIYSQIPQTSAANNNTITPAAPANDPFSNMLSTVTQDSTVKNVTVKKVEKPVAIDTPKPQPIQVVKIDTPLKENVTVVKPEEPKIEETVNQTKPIDTPQIQKPEILPSVVLEPEWKAPPKTVIQRIRRFDSREGIDLVYEILETNNVRDTVRIFIAVDSSVLKNSTPELKQEVIMQKEDTATVTPLPQSPLKVLPQIKKDEVKSDTPILFKKESEKEIKNENVINPVFIPNSNCKESATEEDFLKLRKRMAAQNKEEAMVIEARKIFKTKCFSTAQIKNLGVLFLTDEWRYRFYDAALPFVLDFGSFKSLSDTIADDYYKKRFEALLPNQ
jgi:hypothetical protein